MRQVRVAEPREELGGAVVDDPAGDGVSQPDPGEVRKSGIGLGSVTRSAWSPADPHGDRDAFRGLVDVDSAENCARGTAGECSAHEHLRPAVHWSCGGPSLRVEINGGFGGDDVGCRRVAALATAGGKWSGGDWGAVWAIARCRRCGAASERKQRECGGAGDG